MLYLIFKTFFLYLLKILSRMEVIGAENIPTSGPVILVSNHISNWDPLVVGSASPRQVRFIAKEELFKIPVIKQLLKAWGAMPVKRGRGDREVIAKSLEVLREQNVLGIFIEGKRNKGNREQMLKPQPGAAMLALKSNAPVVPMLVTNTHHIYRLGKVRVYIGKALQFHPEPERDKKELYAETSQRIVGAIESLRQQSRA
ncbi:1-acyl-sn-glycerol-3-phosphate acyltransferase [Hydrogenispora ethanolica]|uniref:1-acyl-sn-glycerol-3-phosphate acyltransferase n=1 Tax=Hydrogenispora ethanolica TaxID=1082276 RepID=A0A4R1RWA7_HYDET|nr:lysophospholipid acyltransferase family protein [Hydrogenispora ethanolica]TCL70965.1 1-acyl-sn-glycerol-3-phosphate acyltransferase [Hydrogenispora ethanolica]